MVVGTSSFSCVWLKMSIALHIAKFANYVKISIHSPATTNLSLKGDDQ